VTTYYSPWRWNPIRGEYEPDVETVTHGRGEISAVEQFRNRSLFVSGATGFLGKVLLAGLLHHFPEVKRLVVQVRRKRFASGEQRFYNEILDSPPLRPVRDQLGEDAIRRKVTVVEGDLGESLCGLSPDRLAELRGRVDLVINAAGLVEFDPPLDESLLINVYGVRHLIELTQRLDAKLVHVSTCYVAGKRNGRIAEDVPIPGYYPYRKGPTDEAFDVDAELRWCEGLVARVTDGRGRRDRKVRDELRDAGMARAEQWGWINTYTYTKAMGEQLIARTPGLEYCIVRPAIVESALRFPMPGWNEGLTTSAPLVLMAGDGLKTWPVRKEGALEVIPVDLVATGILTAVAATLAGRNASVYHLATAAENPLLPPRLVAFGGMRARFKHKHKRSGNRLANLWRTYVETRTVTVEQLEARRARLHRGLDLIHAFLNLLKAIFGQRLVGPYLKSLRATRRHIRQQEQTVDKFLPFMFHNNFVFETRNMRATWDMLTDADRERLIWDPERIDWADYWVNVHTKGIERWIRPEFSTQVKVEDS
jgi:long-chain acyl-CoA synthetase